MDKLKEEGYMLDFGYYNMDCMGGMKEFPDKYFELAIVDPPYGLGDKLLKGGKNGNVVQMVKCTKGQSGMT